MDLSIVIAMYNVKDYLSNCLDSLINQDLNENEYEVLIINDGSTDGSAEIARKYAREYPQIKVFDQEN
ncbi:MAG: glycosyltransferase, partial [Robiginitalea sp.]